MIKQTDIGQLIEQLQTEEGRRVAIYTAISKGLANKQFIDRVFDGYLSTGNYEGALHLATMINDRGKIKRVIKEETSSQTYSPKYKAFKREERRRKSSYRAEALNPFDVARAAKKDAYELIREAEKEGDPKTAEGLYQNAAYSFIASGKIIEAFDLWSKIGDTKRAHQLYNTSIKFLEEFGMYADAAKLAQRKGDEVRSEAYQNLAELLK